MNKNKKYILIALLASLLFTVTIGFSVWIILSEQARGYIQAKGALTHSFSDSYYIGYSWDGEAEYTYTHDTGEQTYKVKGKYTIVLDARTRALSANSDGTYTCKVLFQPSGGFAQWVWGDIEFDQKLTLNTVAKIGNTYYVSIDGALDKAVSKNTVMVLTGSSGVTEAKNARTIGYTSTATDLITVKEGVTLLIPYDESIADTHTPSAPGTVKCTNLAYYTGTVENYGTITIPAVVTGKQRNQAAGTWGERGKGISVVAGNYAHLQNADEDAELVNAGASAVINCYGYLDGTLMMDKGTANLLFSFMDHRGGNCMYQMAQDAKEGEGRGTFPILRYYLASVLGDIHVQAGAVVNGRALVEASDNTFQTPVTLVGTEDTPGFVTLHSNSHAILSYTGQKNVVDLYGDATINEIAVKITMVVSVTISTADSTVPMPYLWEIKMHCLNGRSSASVSTGTTDLSLLPGSKVLVDEGVTFTVHDVAIYEAEACTVLNKGFAVAYGTFDGAELLVKGTLVVTGAVGGEVKAGGPGAIFKTQGTGAKATFTTKDVTGFEKGLIFGGTCTYTDTTRTLQLAKVSGSDTYSTLDTYYSAAKGKGYAWYNPSFEVKFDANDGAFENGGETATFSPSDSSYDGHVPLPEEPTRTYYTFSHWCTDQNCTEGPNSDCNVFGDNGFSKQTYFAAPADPFYAIWTPITYTVNFVYTFNGEPLEEATLPEDIPFTIENAEISLPELTGDLIPTYGEGEQPAQYQFGGWFTAAVGGNAVEGFGKQYCIDRADRETHEITIYARWTKRTYTVHFDFGEYAESMEFDSLTQQAGDYNPASNQTLSNLVISKDNLTDQQYYFGGWYMNAEYTIPYDAEIGIDQEDLDKTEVTLYAKFIKKYFLKIQANDATLDTDALASYTETWHKPGDTVNLPSSVYSNNADNTFDKTYYLLSWTLNGTPLTEADAKAPSRQISGDMTVAIAWANKVELTIDYGENELGIADETKYVIPGKSYPIAHDLSAGNDETDNSLYYDSIDQWTLTNCTISGKTITVGENVANASASLEWKNKRTVNYDVNDGDDNIATPTPQHYRPGGTALTLPTPTRTGYTFLGWFTAAEGGTKIGDADASYEPTENVTTLYAQWEKTAYTITISKQDNAEVTVDKTTAYYGDTVSVKVSFSKDYSKTLTVKDASGNTLLSKDADGTYEFTMPASNVTISASSSGGCFTPGTLITLADGTQKPIEELNFGDKILAWDFFTGTYVEKDISLLVNHGESLYRIANLVFSDGTVLRVIADHGVFDYDLNKYIYLTVDNMHEYIGHRFVQYAADGGYGIVTLTDAYETEEYTSAWSITSAGTSNAFASGLLTVAPPDDFYNWIEMDGKLRYDVEQFQKDVETYGLYTYEDFKDYVTYEQFIDWNGAYLKIAVEKGYFTFDYILELIDLYKGWMPND